MGIYIWVIEPGHEYRINGEKRIIKKSSSFGPSLSVFTFSSVQDQNTAEKLAYFFLAENEGYK